MVLKNKLCFNNYTRNHEYILTEKNSNNIEIYTGNGFLWEKKGDLQMIGEVLVEGGTLFCLYIEILACILLYFYKHLYTYVYR